MIPYDAIRGLLALAAAGYLTLLLRFGSVCSPLFVLGFLLWNLLPFLFLTLFARRYRDSEAALWVVFAGMAILAGGGFFLLWPCFKERPDPQIGLAFLFLTLYQIGLTVPLMGLALLVRRFTRGDQAGEPEVRRERDSKAGV
ncbi:MAG: hypothetical protein NTX64_11295 [Elusimicrobia bacterium]|nr:hypothetical protein [Elusimicrobiota bacterium]